MAALTIATYVANDGATVEAVRVSTVDQVRQLRQLEAWHYGQVRVITYPTADPVAFIGLDQPLSLLGRQLQLGQYVVKGPAGDLDVMAAGVFEERHTEVQS